MVRKELEQKYGTTIRGIVERRTAAGRRSIPGNMPRMLWEVTRVANSLPTSEAVGAWLERAPANEVGPILIGYQELCRAANERNADATLRARLALGAESLAVACCHFALWWYDRHAQRES